MVGIVWTIVDRMHMLDRRVDFSTAALRYENQSENFSQNFFLIILGNAHTDRLLMDFSKIDFQ